MPLSVTGSRRPSPKTAVGVPMIGGCAESNEFRTKNSTDLSYAGV